MNPITMLLGVLICLYAILVLVTRLQGQDEKFRKLEPMRRFWGPRLGSAIHYLGYVLIPLVFGIGMIVAGLKGVSLLAFMDK